MQLALFDFDHTLTRCDSYARFLRRVAAPERQAQAKWALGPSLLGYRLGLVSAESLRRRATRLAFTGLRAEAIQAHGQAYAREILPGLLRPEMMRRLDWHRARGHEVVVVSGSLDAYLSPWCEALGLELICNRLERRGTRFTGRYAGRDIGRHKADEIRARFDLPAYARIHAYGDSAEDRPMLALAHERWYRGARLC